MNIFFAFRTNEVFMTTMSAWVITQLIKVSFGVIREKRFSFTWLVGTGGMPSSHSAGAMAMATTCGLLKGFDSIIFGIAILVALVTMFDAQGVRRAAGCQAEMLNKMLDDLYNGHPLQQEKLKALLGHTPFQVFIGGLLGVVISLIWHNFIF